MQVSHRPLLFSVLAALLAVSGCEMNSPWGSSNTGTAYGGASVSGNTGGTGSSGGSTTSPPGGVGAESGTAGTDDIIVATSSEPGVSVAVGSSQTLSVTFTSSDGRPITGFGVSGTLGLLPAGWSGPATFTCKLVMAGSACVLNLTYAPTAADSGSLAINYIYVDNASLSKAPGGSITIPYQAISQNNAVATAMPSGQINALIGSGTQSVSVTFTSDTANAALDEAITGLTLTTDLTALPQGWSSTASSFSCAVVTTGSGCQLMLSYAPTAAARGTLTLDYSYTDDSGAARTGALNIAYATTTSNNVVATASPAGQIIAVEKTGSQAVAVDFNTDDGRSASNLIVTSSLSALPAGWRSGSTGLSCGTVSTGNGCQLRLTYAPASLGTGTLTLAYAYEDDAGNQQTGTLDIPYAATTDDNVVATPAPLGQIDAVVGQAAQNVEVVFTTDDMRLATALQVTSDLTALPAGWSGPAGLSCVSVSTGSACRMSLSYAPTGYDLAGTLVLDYSYVNNAGQTKTGSFDIPYRARTDDSIGGTPTVGGTTIPSLAYVVGVSTPTTVTMTFVTNDTNPAIGVPSTSNAFTITSGLDPLPAGWSASSGTFNCPTVSDGTVCQLPLRYAPTAVTNGPQTLTLSYSYVNDAGFANTGTASLSYTATSNNSVEAALSPSSSSSSPIDVAIGSPQPVTLSLTTSDGNPVTALTVSAPSPLPSGWSWSGPSNCPTGSLTSCQLTLSYAPTQSSGGTQSLAFSYSYTNNAGSPRSGVATLYSVTP